MFQFFRKKLPLGKQDIPLGKYIAGYELCSPLYVEDGDVLYLGATREVRYRALIPDGPQGYYLVKVPPTVKTVEALLRYLEKKRGFHLKK